LPDTQIELLKFFVKALSNLSLVQPYHQQEAPI